MSKRLNAKYKIDRRYGENIWGRPKSPVNTRSYRPGQHGVRRRKLSDFGLQLNAKQKLKNYYGNIGERQFRRYFKEAVRLSGDTSENLVGLLERRLDTVVYRLKFAATVFAARQLINHGHIRVNGKRVNIASYLVSEGDEIEIKEKSKKMLVVLEASQLVERDVPEFLVVDHTHMKGKLVRTPSFGEIPYAAQMEPNLVIEFYSR